MKAFKVLVLLLLLLLLPAWASAADITAANCSQGEVQARITQAVTGDRVLIPACGATSWSSGISIPSSKAIEVLGAGIGVTNITAGTSSDLVALNISNGGSGVTRFGNLTINANSTASTSAVIQVSGGTGQDRFRVHHVKIDNLRGRGVRVEAGGPNFSGLVDHNQITQLGTSPHAFEPRGYPENFACANGVPPSNDPCNNGFDVAPTHYFGTSNMTFFEDNTVTADDRFGDGALDGYGGAKFVFRHNTIINAWLGVHGADSGPYRGVHSFEIYANTFTNNLPGGANSAIPRLFFFRSGSGPIYDNVSTGFYNGKTLTINRIVDTGGGSGGLTFGGLCSNGTSPWDGNAPDANHPGATGWPCLDQSGWIFGHNQGSARTLTPVFFWNNLENGSLISISTDVSAYQKSGIEYVNSASRPAGTGTYLATYAAYPYPHPLQGAVAHATKYVDNSGAPACANTSSNGTEAAPFCTLAYGLGQITGGDTLYVKTGTYNEAFRIGGDTYPTLAGTAGQTTKILAFPGHTPILRGSGIGGGRMKISNTSYVDFEGFQTTNHQHGLYVDDDCGPVFGCPASHINVRNVTAHDVGGECFAIRGNVSFILIENSTAYNCGLSGSENGEGIYVGGSNASDASHDITIRNNIVHDTKDEGIELKHDSYNIVVEGNEVYRALSPGSSFSNTGGAIETNPSQGAHAGNPNIIIRNNLIHDIGAPYTNSTNGSGFAIQLDVGATVYNNILYNIGTSNGGTPYTGIESASSDGFSRLIYHNTIDMPSARAVQNNGGGTTDSRNNIGPTGTNNLATSAAYFVNQAAGNYHLLAGTAPVNAGADLTSVVATDFDGVVRVLPVDIGAFELVGAGGFPSRPTNLTVQ